MAGKAQRRAVDPAQALEYAEEDRLSAAANSGDRAAAGEFLLRTQRFLLATARRLATGAIDPDDLLADALVNLLALWKAGTGPNEKAAAYVVRSMRNRMIDEFRSPRSRVLPLMDAEEHLPTVTQDTRHIELDAEYRRVRAALQMLPADQQHVLRATIIDGRRPAELEEELDRPAAAIYALSLRARKGLRRATLRVFLEEGTPRDECRHAATRLPATVTEDVDDADDSPGMEHIRDCRRCRAAWGRFASTATLLGVATLLVVGNAVLVPASAEASEHPSADQPPARPAPADAVAHRTRAPIGRLFESLWPVLAIITGLGLLLAVVVPPVVEQFAAPVDVPNSDLVVTSVITEPGRASLEISLSGEDEESSSIALTLPDGLSIIATPQTWDCTQTDAVLTCAIDGPPAGVIDLADTRAEQVGDYRLEVSAVVGAQTLTGAAWGQIGSEAQTVRASVR